MRSLLYRFLAQGKQGGPRPRHLPHCQSAKERRQLLALAEDATEGNSGPAAAAGPLVLRLHRCAVLVPLASQEGRDPYQSPGAATARRRRSLLSMPTAAGTEEVWRPFLWSPVGSLAHEAESNEGHES